jgi:hypothetical protein
MLTERRLTRNSGHPEAGAQRQPAGFDLRLEADRRWPSPMERDVGNRPPTTSSLQLPGAAHLNQRRGYLLVYPTGNRPKESGLKTYQLRRVHNENDECPWVHCY